MEWIKILGQILLILFTYYIFISDFRQSVRIDNEGLNN